MYKFSLEKYRGKATRHTCPNCNKPLQFIRYVDTENGEYLSAEVGRCNRQSKCGYHYKPRDYFAANPNRKNQRKPIVTPPKCLIEAVKVDFIAREVFEKRLTDYERNALVTFLCNLFPDKIEAVEKVVRDYKIGTFEDGRTIFWQIDKDGKIRTGKLIAYNEATGKRRKNISVSWVHSEMAKTGEVKKGFNLEQCFFGEHLVTSETAKPIAIVEAEKTAVIASLFFPEMLWMATGGENNLQIEKLKRLGRRTMILYPDADAFENWQKIADEAKALGINIKVSSIIETAATDTDKANGNDLADYLVEQQKQKTKPKSKTYTTAQLLDKIFNDKKLSAEFEIIFEERIAINEFMFEITTEEAEVLAVKPESLKRIIESVLKN